MNEAWRSLVLNSFAISLSVLLSNSAWYIHLQQKASSEEKQVTRGLITGALAFLGAFLPFAATYLVTGYLPMGRH